jgi:hypothetical protein
MIIFNLINYILELFKDTLKIKNFNDIDLEKKVLLKSKPEVCEVDNNLRPFLFMVYLTTLLVAQTI